ncbi:MAG TPA: phosphodiester glycosidase family protein [Acidimicrobiales bacterium]|nr:phosphodiester glycosidase family protein [Acidimicrobiales bacterium]
MRNAPPTPRRPDRPRSDNGVLPSRYVERRPPTRPTHRNQRRRRLPRILLVIPTLVLVVASWALIGAATTPGNQSYAAKVADWMRGHDMAFITNNAERVLYNFEKPPKGGRPKHLNALPATGGSAGPSTSSGHTAKTVVAHLPAPSPVPLVVHPALPGEGQWKPVGPTVDGYPGMYESQFRADTVYTSELTTAVWIDPKLMKLSLIPGQGEPGGTWPHPPYITHAELPTIAAAFNGGFRFADAHGGFYLNGRTAIPLRKGAASFVIYKNGHVNIGAWGTEVKMTPNVVSVLQNLVPMVDHGVVSPTATYNDVSVWGATLGASTVVARSGLGITKDGALVYVAGPYLTARTLAESLQRAGAIRAMTLDINPEWVTFNFFGHPNPSNPYQVSSAAIYPQQQRPSTRYLGPTLENRDFVEVRTPTPVTAATSGSSPLG